MKKITFLFLALIFSACLSPSGGASPQVTVTSEVTVTSTLPPDEMPIPTPTFHPQFKALQEKIENPSERFTLQPDGTIQDGAETVPGINVSSDGMMSLEVNGETVVLDPADVNFDDENGISIKGYEWDENEGSWVEAISPAEAQFDADMEKWGIDLEGEDKDKFEMGTDEEGKITLTEKESGKVIYRDGNWEVMFLGEMIREQGVCKITPWEGKQIGPSAPPDLQAHKDQYAQPLVDAYLLYVKNRMIRGSGLLMRNYYLGGQCWGVTFYQTEDQPSAWFFWKNENGSPKYEKVFQTPRQ